MLACALHTDAYVALRMLSDACVCCVKNRIDSISLRALRLAYVWACVAYACVLSQHKGLRFLRCVASLAFTLYVV